MKTNRILASLAKSRAIACFFVVLCCLLFNGFETRAQLSSAACNTYSALINPTFSNLTVTSSQAIGDQFSTKANVIDNNISNSSTFTYLVAGSAWIQVKDNSATAANTYPAGSFAGFAIDDNSLLTALGTTRITTYLGNDEQESKTTSALVSTGIVSGVSRAGFYTTKSFDRVRFTYTALGAGNISVYYAVVEKFCAAASPLVCNTPTAVNNPVYPTFVNPDRTGTTGIGTLTTSENAVDASTSNSAGLSVIGIGSSFLSVKDQITDYPAKTFAGFDIENTAVLNLGVFNNITLKTYLDGALQETKTASNGLLSIGLLSSSGRQRVGFVSAQPFDEIQITISATLSLNLGSTLVYNAVFETFCDGAELTCNTPTSLTSPSYPVIISTPNTGVTGAVCANCQVTNTGNLIDANPSNHADIVLTGGLAVSGSVAVKSVEQSYPAGTFAGFDINSPSIIGVGVLSGLRIETYLNGVATGDVFGNGSLINASAPLLSGSGRQVIGFLTTQEFDEIKLTVQQTAGVTLGTTEVYGAVFTRFCAGTPLACNTLTPVTNPGFPVYVDGKNTGITSVACVACTVNNSDYAIDSDPNTAATIVMAVGAASSGSFAVANAIDTYAATSFAGFDVETATLLSAGVLSTATISLYNNGTLVQTGTGNALIIGASTALLTGTSRQIVGLVATAAYDEVKITFDQVAGANLGNIKIYGAIFDKLCQGTIACNNSYFLTQPAFPVVINAARTGVTGVACVGCAVQDPWNVISSSNSDFSRITLTANVGATAAISVVDPISTYPAGTAAGFVIRNVNSIAQIDLLNSITIETYNDGVLQESKAGATLLNLELLNIITVGTGTPLNPSFITTKPFDEIRIVATSLASVINTIDVFGAFVDTRTVVGGGALSCNAVKNPDFNATQINVPVPGNVSTNDVVPAGTTYGPTATPGGSNPSGGTLVLNPDGTYTFTGTSVGVYTYTVPVCIPETPCVSVPLVITVTDPTKLTNPPVANTDIASVKGAAANPGSVTINVKANDGPGNKGGTLGDPTPTSPAHGSASVVNGNIVYTPAAGYYGEDSFTYSVCETPSTLCATTTVYVTVKQPNAANSTSAADDYVSVPLGINAEGNVSSNDTDPEGNAQSVTPQSITDTKGTFTLLADGSYTFEPASGFSGPVDFAYTTCDNGAPSACASATLHLLVNPVPDLITILTVDPTNTTGTTNITLVGEIYNIPVVSTSTNGSQITVYVAKNPLIELSFNSSAILIGGKTVHNSVWTFDANSNTSFYILKTTAIINDSDSKSFGLTGVVTPGSSSGKLNITSFIDSGSGGEINDLNNSDAESIIFFKN